jgi:hypothetical protein
LTSPSFPFLACPYQSSYPPLIQDPSNQFQFDEIEDDDDDVDDDGENDEDRQVPSNFNQRVVAATADNSAAFDANFANFDAAFEANFGDFSNNAAATATSSSSTAAFDASFDDDVDVLDILASEDLPSK